MANITVRKDSKGNTKYRVQVRLKGAPTLTATFARKTDAKRWAQQEEARIREGRHFRSVEAKRHTLADLIRRYRKSILPQKPKSIAKQSAQLDWWEKKLGYCLLSDLSPAKISEARDDLASEIVRGGKKRGPATIKRYLAVLSHACTIAVREWGWLEANPVQNVSKPREPRGRVRFLDEDELKRLLLACKASSNQYLYPIVFLAVATGMRKSEIINLRWRNVDLEKGRITLHETKNNERRMVHLSPKVRNLLTELSNVRHIDTDLLFPAKWPRKGKPANRTRKGNDVPADIRLPWEIALKKAEIEDFRFHDLRHTAASYLAMNGASMAEIMDILGHKTLEMVKRYSHLSEGHTAKILEDMNEKIFK